MHSLNCWIKHNYFPLLSGVACGGQGAVDPGCQIAKVCQERPSEDGTSGTWRSSSPEATWPSWPGSVEWSLAESLWSYHHLHQSESLCRKEWHWLTPHTCPGRIIGSNSFEWGETVEIDMCSLGWSRQVCLWMTAAEVGSFQSGSVYLGSKESSQRQAHCGHPDMHAFLYCHAPLKTTPAKSHCFWCFGSGFFTMLLPSHSFFFGLIEPPNEEEDGIMKLQPSLLLPSLLGEPGSDITMSHDITTSLP